VRLLFITQVLDRNDPILGFTVRWIEGLARLTDRVRVIALEVGDTEGLGDNVDWRVVGRQGRIKRYLLFRRHLKEAFDDGFGHVLTHMVPRYSLVAAGPARRAGARHFMWYTHAGVDGRLRRAVQKVECVFTASSESLGLDPSNKVVTGHGIDLVPFPRIPLPTQGPRVLLSAGRLTPSKDPKTILHALALLLEEGRDVCLEWAGGALAQGDPAFGAEVRNLVESLGLEQRVRFLGPVPPSSMPEIYQRSSLFLSASRTGSVDKVVLEAMATGRGVVTSNPSFPPLLTSLGAERSGRHVFEEGNPVELAAKTGALLDLDPGEHETLGDDLRGIIERDHEVDALMARLVERMGVPL
jgi:glycosyltransferase involved in cell wall biosynthesis